MKPVVQRSQSLKNIREDPSKNLYKYYSDPCIPDSQRTVSRYYN